MTQAKAIREIHDRVRQCFTRHQFRTFGDALGWWQNEGYDIKTLEAGEQGESKFSTDILWLISQLGPKLKVNHDIMDVRKVPKLKPVKVLESDEKEVTTPPKPASRKRKSRRRLF